MEFVIYKADNGWIVRLTKKDGSIKKFIAVDVGDVMEILKTYAKFQ
jgi:hypothetical protein